jgi:probable HAF family extracellular repeat protein
MAELRVGPGVESAAYGINNRGQVVGSLWWFSEGDVATFHACLLENGVVADLGAMGAWSDAMSINDNGQIAGTVDVFDGEGYSQHAFLWRAGSMTDLGSAGSYSSAYCINNRGSVVGIIGQFVDDFYSGFLWERGNMGIVSQRADAFCINDRNQVGGDAWTDEAPTHAVLWENGRQIDLGGLGGSSSNAYGINNHGDLVGYSMTEGDAYTHAVLWTKHVSQDIIARAAPASAQVAKPRMQKPGVQMPPFPAFGHSKLRHNPLNPLLRSTRVQK